jgi:hypothetical protein
MGGGRIGLAAVAFTAVVSFACGSSDDEGGSANSEMIDVFRAIGHANCHLWFRCCPASKLTPRELLGASEAECIRHQDELAPAAPYFYRESLAAGRLVFHVDQARACLAAIESATCSTSESQIDCDLYPIFEPRVSLGQACAWDEECINGFCDRDLATEDFGKCVARAANGAPCNADHECSSEQCGFAPGGNRCVDRSGNGEDCNFDSECASGKCVCEMLEPDQVDCLGATGACGPPPPENGCTLD